MFSRLRQFCLLQNQGFSKILTGWLLAGILLCAPAMAQDESASLPDHYFTKLYSEIITYHLNPPVAKQLFYWTVTLTQGMDRNIQTREGDRLVVYYQNRPFLAYRVPADNDAAMWASISQNFIERLYTVSVPLRQYTIEELGQKITASLLQSLDRYSHISFTTNPNEMPTSLAERGGIAGIGVTVKTEDGRAQIIGVVAGGPAFGRLHVGDILTGIDDKKLQGERASDIVQMLRGENGSAVRLSIERQGEPQMVELRRAILGGKNVRFAEQNGVISITIQRFAKGTAQQVAAILQDRKNIKGVVLDLRGDRGGVLDEATAVADLFLQSGEMVRMRGRHPGSNFDFKASNGGLKISAPLAVLIDGYTASSAEVLAVSLQHNNRAVVIGSNSYGKGTVQRASYIPGIGQAAISWAELYVPGAKPQALSENGVRPDICLAAFDKILPHPDKKAPEPGKELVWLRRAPQITWNSKTCPREPRQDRAADAIFATQVLNDPTLYDKILKNNNNPA